MPQTNYTPILIYASGTTGNTPAAGNLTNSSGGSELAINYFDGRLFYKDASNVVRVLASRGTGTIGGSNNQVQYNSGGVLAGSANLTFDGANLGVGTASPAAQVDVRGNSGVTLQVYETSTGNNNRIQIIQSGAVSTYNSTFTSGSAAHAWQIASAEQMRLNTTGLGIGTTNPTSRLQIESNTDANAFAFIRNSNTGTSSASSVTVSSAVGGVTLRAHSAANSIWPNAALIASDATLTGGLNLFQSGASHIALWTNSTERMRLDSSGNLGIGTSTPTAPLHFGKSVYGTTSSENFFRIKFEDAGGIQNDVGIGQPSSGAMGFNVDTSTGFYQWNIGTTTERMRLDVFGNLLVGTTTNTNSSRLTVNGTISETVSSVQYLVASQFDVGTAPNKIPLNQYLGNLAYQNASAIAGQAGFSAGTAALPSIASATDLTTGRWFPAAGVMAWSTGGVERMRLDASGNLGVGLTNPSARVHASAADAAYQLGISGTTRGIRVETNATESRIVGVDQTLISSFQPISIGGLQVVIRTNGTTEAARFNSSGNLALGNITPSAWYTSPFIDIGQYGAIGNNSGGGGGFALYANAFEDTGGTFKYKQNYFAALYRTFAGIHQWFTAPSGTAGNAVTFTEAARITTANTQVLYQPAESAQNTSATLSVAQLQTRIITSNAAVTLTLPTGTTLEGYTSSMVVDTAFECTFIATTANAITIAANGNTTVGSLTVAGNTSGTFRFRKTATNTFTVYRVA